MTARRAKLYTLAVKDIIVAGEAYECYTYNSKQKPFLLNDKEWATGTDSKVNVERWPVETIQIDGKNEYLVLSPHLREYLELPFQGKLDDARSDARDLRRECRLLRDHLEHARTQVDNLSAPWYVKLQRRLKEFAS